MAANIGVSQLTASRSTRPIVSRSEPAASVIEGLTGIDPLFARLYVTRGVTAAMQLDYGLAALAPVSSLENINAAVALLCEKRDQRITVVGDFDVDGATSTALVLRCLRAFGFAREH